MFFKIECLENFVMRTSYKIKAENIDEAIQKIKDRDVMNYHQKLEEVSDFLHVVDHDEVDPEEEDVSDFE